MAADAARGRPLRERLWRSPPPAALRAPWLALAAASCVYAGIIALRARRWRGRAAHADAPIISVGNLTVGGNGKTPFTLYLANLLAARGRRVAILSRGFGGGGSRRGHATIVADGRRLLATPSEAGDEPVMMTRRFAGPVAIARRRIDGVRLLMAASAPDAIILDDGFQHLALARDLDLVLIDAARGFGNGWLLPAGPMRERIGALARADAIVLVDRGGESAPRAIELRLPPEIPVIRAHLRPCGLLSPGSAGWREGPLTLAGRRVIAVSGLADPDAFHAALATLGASVVATFAFPDHHAYSRADWKKILAAAGAAEMIVTTAKDLVKLESFAGAAPPLYALDLEVALDHADEARLIALVEARLDAWRVARRSVSGRRNGGLPDAD